MSKYKIIGFNKVTLGGLAVNLETELGLFRVFSITKDLRDIEFDYAKLTDKEYFTKSSEIDIDYGNDFYDKLKKHVIQTLKELELDKHAAKLWHNN